MDKSGKSGVAILDCGGQYTKVIDRKTRESLVKSDIFPVGVPAREIAGYGGIILTGGPESVWAENSLRPDPAIFGLGIPILGICYGMHLVVNHYGGGVSGNVKKEYGEAEIDLRTDCPLFGGLSAKETVLMSHGDSVSRLPENFIISAKSGEVVAGIYNEEKRVYAVQFHPEVDLTVNGKAVFNNFLRKICGITEVYSLEDRLQASIEQVRQKTGDGNVIVLVSGGVDSAVAAGILLKALDNDKVYAVHVDHGLMRKDESDLICESLKKEGMKNLIRINAGPVFFEKLAGVTEPEKKRDIIGTAFITELQREMAKLRLDQEKTFIAQGTLRPDLIESGNPDVSGHAKKIKTHHNDVDVIRESRARGMIIETNYDWHKDEVRQIARMLGLPDEVANRQPFPGPGLGVRILCGDGTKTVDREQAEKFQKFMEKTMFWGNLLPVSSVGVQGDNRTYAELAAIGGGVWKTVRGEERPELWDEIRSTARGITNNLPFINRVALIVAGGGSELGIEGAKARECFVCAETAELLREIDHIATTALKGFNISQAFAVLLPFGRDGRFSVALRTFVTNDFMTGRPMPLGPKGIPFELIAETADEIKMNFEEIDFVLYDVTAKPPATCEWE
ncbi:MAG: glutamine-hydrolyzing GMP synthase [Clostridiales bacterium]|jgi:GMP synthase (glutamine-hydrolysing)|nr:glutamine-hydrolyzing GMP synthase [Clostridiales bacterium]